MITEGILNVLFSFFNVLVTFLPSFTISADIASSVAQVLAWAGWVNYYIPLDMAWTAIGIVIASWIPSILTHLFLELF